MKMFWFNRHRRLRDRLSAYIDRELDASAAERLERHLVECGRCRQELEHLRATVAALQELPAVEPPRSFALSPERVAAPRPPLPAASPLAFGARIAAAGVAAALAVVLVVDIGDFGGDGIQPEAPLTEIAAEREADEGAGATTAGEAAGVEGDETSSAFDAAAGEAETPPAAPDEAEQLDEARAPAVAPNDAEQPDEAKAPAVAPADGGGIDALTAAEIGLAAALGVLVSGSLALAFAGRRRR